MTQIDSVAALKDALSLLSRADIEQAWAAADAAAKALGNSSPALRAEMAARLLASVLAELGATTQRQDGLSDVLPAVEALALYVRGAWQSSSRRPTPSSGDAWIQMTA